MEEAEKKEQKKRKLWLRLFIGLAVGIPLSILLLNDAGKVAGRPAALVATDAATLLAVPLFLLILGSFRLKLWARVLIALALGIGFGLLWKEGAGALEPIGRVFINLIKMLIVPLILTTLVAGVASMGHPETLGRLGLKAFVLYMATTAFAIMIGLGFGVLFEPGSGLTIEGVEPRETAAASQSLVDRLVDLVPTNPVEALATANVLQIILFALLLGVGIVLAGERGRGLKEFFDSASEVMLRITRIVMEMAPFGVFALIAVVASSYGVEVLESLAKLIIVVYAACITHIVVVYWGLIRLVANLPVIRFIRGVFDAQAVAYSTSSSSATLPVTIAVARDNLGVDKSTSGFVLPLGATINMDGTALYLGILAVFASQIFPEVHLGLADYGAIVLTATLASVGAAGIPSASLVLIGIVLSSVGFSAEQTGIVLALIFGVDRVMDMMRTLTNITGDATVSVLVSKSEGGLDEVVYRTPAVR